MSGMTQSLLRTWGGRLPERAHAKGYRGKLGNSLFLTRYMLIKHIDLIARHCPVTVLREWCYRRMGIKIGKGTFVDRDVYFDTVWPELISIGAGVSIAQCTILLCHEYDTEHYSCGDMIHELPHIIEPIKIEDNVMIGSRVTILPGVTIGEGSIIGTGAVVRKDIPPWSIAVGVPARVIRRVNGTEEENESG